MKPNHKKTSARPEPKNNEVHILTFPQAWKWLIDVLKWKFSPKTWKGTRIYIAGKMRTVTGERYDTIFVSGLKHEIRKDSRYIRKV